MARLSLTNLPDPAPEFDPALALDSDDERWFETEVKAAQRDRQRARRLRRLLKSHALGADAGAARRLQRRLQNPKRIPASLASARCMRVLRRRLGGALWKLVRNEQR